MLGACNTCVRLQFRVTNSGITVDSLTIFFLSFFFFSSRGKGLGYKVRLGFSWRMGVVLLIGMNTRVLSGWLGSKISAGYSGRVSHLGQLGPFHFPLILNVFIYSFLYFLKHLDFHWQIYLFIYWLNYLFLNFWYFFIPKLNCFFQGIILCVFECPFCSFAVRVCLCVPVTYLHVSLDNLLYFVCACCVFVQDLYMFVPMLVCIYVHLYVFVFRILCECLCLNCQTTRALQQSQTVFIFSCKKRKCCNRCFL